VPLKRSDISEELIATNIRVARIGELGILRSVLQLPVTANVACSPVLVTVMMEALRSSETPDLTRVTRRNIPEDFILHSRRLENLRSYTIKHYFTKTYWEVVVYIHILVISSLVAGEW
jgi:hypothetical protein